MDDEHAGMRWLRRNARRHRRARRAARPGRDRSSAADTRRPGSAACRARSVQAPAGGRSRDLAGRLSMPCRCSSCRMASQNAALTACISGRLYMGRLTRLHDSACGSGILGSLSTALVSFSALRLNSKRVAANTITFGGKVNTASRLVAGSFCQDAGSAHWLRSAKTPGDSRWLRSAEQSPRPRPRQRKCTAQARVPAERALAREEPGPMGQQRVGFVLPIHRAVRRWLRSAKTLAAHWLRSAKTPNGSRWLRSASSKAIPVGSFGRTVAASSASAEECSA